MTQAQRKEVNKIIQERVQNIVEERLMAELWDNVADYAGELAGKMTTIKTGLSEKDEKQMLEILDTFTNALLQGVAIKINKQLK